jgi:methylenetetrahydrofolate--tRNA-(uracil-5-)-methyltransferase
MGVRIIGAGLAGSEAAWQIASRGIEVHLVEMRPRHTTKAHKTSKCAELVCSNSFRGADLANAVGLLKEELRRLGSLIMEAADFAKVPAGGALAVDREVFSAYVDERIRSHPLIRFHTEEFSEIPKTSIDAPLIIATGPLTSPNLAHSIEKLLGQGNLAFFDAISPIVMGDTIDYSKVFRQSRYDKGEGSDYLNVPLREDEYRAFVRAVEEGEKFGGHDEVESDHVENLRPFEGCMPIEEMISRGPETLRFGPMKPVGLIDPRTGERPFAVLQLRQDDKQGTLWSMVGFQTRLRHGEQVRIFRMLPGLEKVEFVRLGSVHRNSFLDSPKCLLPTLQLKHEPGIFFAGQITGVEGYVESTAGGMVAGVNVARMISGRAAVSFPVQTAIGALMGYISEPSRKEFQPMNISFGLMPHYFEQEKVKRQSKAERRLIAAQRALSSLEMFIAKEELMEQRSQHGYG